MKAYTHEVDHREVVLDMMIRFVVKLSVSSLVWRALWVLFSLAGFSSHEHCPHCSYEGDVDIDAEVKPPITAGVKGLKVSFSFFS